MMSTSCFEPYGPLAEKEIPNRLRSLNVIPIQKSIQICPGRAHLHNKTMNCDTNGVKIAFATPTFHSNDE